MDRCKTVDSLSELIPPVKIKTALLVSKRNKAPGRDGIPIMFYIFFWDLIGSHLLVPFILFVLVGK
jgi:hypothetical protein